ncbi:MAG: SIMPL domain-containing protein [Pseudolysinimonas sp.]
MSETVITVQGSSSIKHAAERATVSVAVAHDGPARDKVFAQTTKVSDTMTTALKGLLDTASGPVIAWSSDRVSVWSERPWNNEGAQLPLVFHATIGLRATFSDFDALARWVETVATTSGVTVGSIDWELLDATRDTLLEQVRTKAVQDAAAKALVYARAAGLTSLTATAIADPGLLGSPDAPSLPFGAGPAAPRMFAAKAMSDGGALSFTPQELEVAALVDARFAAR